MEPIGARVVDFDTTGSFTTYTTEVTLNGATDPAWLLAIRYSTFATAHAKLVALDSEFHFDFPPKGGFFSSPSPKTRQPKLDEFVQRALEHLARREFPQDLCAVVEDLLDVKENLARVREPESEMENDATCCASGKCHGESEPMTEDNNENEELARTEEGAVETVAVPVEENEATVVETGVETTRVEEQEVKTEMHVDATATAAAEETTTTTTMVVDPGSVQTKSATKQTALEVASITTTTTASGVEVQHVQFANGMSLKKKTLTAEQKRLRNLRRKEKRKKKGGVKIRGARSASQCADGASTEEDE